MSKTLILVLVGILVILGVWYMSMTKESQGRVVFTVTDAAASLENLTSVTMSVDKVEVQNASNGWVTVSDKDYDFDLLKLKNSGALELLADVKLDAGTYNQIRLNISKVVVVKAGQSLEAKLPSSDLKIVGRLVVEAGGTSTAILDFLLDKSLHVTGNGLYVFAPVVKLMTQSDASADVKADRTVTLGNGKADANVTVGMNEKGETKENYEVGANAKVEISAGGSISVGAKSDIKPVVVSLSAQNNSGMTGKATLTKVDGKVQVKLELMGPSMVLPKPAHIHVGPCASIGAVKYPLNNVVTGNSTTILNVSMDQLKAEMPLAVNVHKSAVELGTYVACGDVKF